MSSLAALGIGISAGGFALSALLHLSVLLGYGNPLGEGANFLFYGIFLAAFPTMFVSESASKGRSRSGAWLEAIRFSPPWLRALAILMGVYAVANFFLSEYDVPRVNDAVQWARVISGHCAAAYALNMAMLVSFVNADAKVPRCINGHRMNRGARFCEACGQAGLPEGERDRPD